MLSKWKGFKMSLKFYIINSWPFWNLWVVSNAFAWKYIRDKHVIELYQGFLRCYRLVSWGKSPSLKLSSNPIKGPQLRKAKATVAKLRGNFFQPSKSYHVPIFMNFHFPVRKASKLNLLTNFKLAIWKVKGTRATGFEPARAEPIWFRVRLLNHSDKLAVRASQNCANLFTQLSNCGSES